MSAVPFILVTLPLATLFVYLYHFHYFVLVLVDLYDFQSFFRGRCQVHNFAVPTGNNKCEHVQHYCGDTAFKLKYPFRFEGDPRSCGKPELELSCRHNRTILHSKSELEGNYYVDVKSIDYERRTFQVTDPGVRKNDCSTLPLYSFNPSYPLSRRDWEGGLHVGPSGSWLQALVFVRCERQPKRNLRGGVSYIDTAPCNISANQFSSHHSKSSQIYAVLSLSWQGVAPRDIQESCTITKIVPIQIEFYDFQNESYYFLNKSGNLSFQDIHNQLAQGYGFYYFDSRYKTVDWLSSFLCCLRNGVLDLVLVLSARYVIGILLLVAFLIYKCSRRHLSMYDTVEEFLQRNSSLMPIRYSYREIKAMTNNFKEKLGEGGYGLVYKGKLRSGSLVAVKMLNKSRANGKEFINEVMTIGRIHHVNVVRLVGFCVTSSERALVYDYMPNGSLDKFISKSNSLSWKTAYEIAMGVARGIAYLHQGCNMQILHFDIKPHNILLDEDLVPKVSDFGLAKLYPAQDSYVATLTAVRGTLGYMAPELFYKKVGRVSSKADVYSFGMLVMDMAGRWRNEDGKAERQHSSQIYFTCWVHDKFEQGVDIEIGDQVTDEEKAIAKKLILTALWCLQMTPTDRPSMKEVIEMLQGDLEGLQFPPKPQFYPTDSLLDMQSGPSSDEESAEPLYSRSVTLEIEQIDD